MDQLWANRAASSEAAVAQRHLKRLWALPGTQLGVVAWPATRRDRLFGTWHYWWQAHLLDCLVDAQQRDPQPQRHTEINRQVRAHRLRNNFRWTNSYYDDMAWLALALERAGRIAGVQRSRALPKLADQFLKAWVPEDGGGIPWRKQDQFFNAPANGPAAVFLARYDDRIRRAQQMADWIDETQNQIIDAIGNFLKDATLGALGAILLGMITDGIGAIAGIAKILDDVGEGGALVVAIDGIVAAASGRLAAVGAVAAGAVGALTAAINNTPDPNVGSADSQSTVPSDADETRAAEDLANRITTQSPEYLRDLGTDTETGQFRQSEADTGARYYTDPRDGWFGR